MKIKYSKAALKFLAGVQKKIADSIREAVNGLTHTPPEGDVKIMQGYNDGRMRLRVGKYRVIYRYDTDNELKILYIIDIGSRGDIYK
ncbi:MAG: type II toxin-antitoxin system RelE/ParE family toxin [Ruminococcus sp.]|nr:type II toxin-antitoxin system RelE/ParE family toxin [Ruminococcus sp.]MCM1382746.1 type II toxin-antitoxin system RelE/ParE family toxin [Muribaculaceae bacterium]MCM1480458.1 type II toxin-antitoxin system RelE/ParE family toxin [Muribaculaceae bacterium]